MKLTNFFKKSLASLVMMAMSTQLFSAPEFDKNSKIRVIDFWRINKVLDEQKTIAAFDGGWSYFEDQDLVVGSYDDTWFQAYKMSTRELLWSVNIGSSISVQAVVLNKKLLVATESGEIYCFDLKDGKVIWRQALGNESIRRDLVAIPEKNSIIVYPTSEKIVMIDDDGKVKWRRDLKGAGGLQLDRMAPPLVVGSKLIVGNKSGVIHQLDLSTGQIQSKHKVFGRSSKSLFMGLMKVHPYNGSYLFAGANGEVVLMDQNFSEKWRVKTEGDLTAVSPIKDDFVYLAGNNKELLRLDLKAGKLSTVLAMGSIANDLEFNPEGLLYWFGSQGLVGIIEPKSSKLMAWTDLESIISSVFYVPKKGFYLSTQAKNLYGLDLNL